METAGIAEELGSLSKNARANISSKIIFIHHKVANKTENNDK